ncbi:hypothetical protein ONE63_011533 [Megalurothrips usitatus]|uniref:RNA-directed DNA polymerase n=1 Tax=Megalurothrips usitatus TaxID=439358 RepID=A0AAV7X271_9NEOP|nr:hypothetical protein ONE63_011533 [Megalurothrips usitatus]
MEVLSVRAVLPDPEEDLLHGDEDGGEDEPRHCPEVIAALHGEEVRCLLDTGAEASCVSAELWGRMHANEPDLPVLPLNGVRITGAVGTRSQPVRSQALLRVLLGDAAEEVVFLIVPDLVRGCILGNDFFRVRKATIDYDREELRLKGGTTVKFAGVAEVKRRLRVHHLLWATAPQLLQINNVELEGLMQAGSLRRGGPRVNLAVREQSPPVVVASLSDPASIESQIREAVNKAETTDDAQRQELYSLLLRYRSVFNERPGCIEAYTPVLEVNDATGFVEPQYPLPRAYEPAMDALIRQWEQWGIVSRGPSKYISPLVIVPKADGSIRACLDGRRISRLLVQDHERTQSAEELMQRHHEARWLTTMDASSGYLHIKLRPQDRQFLAFLYKGRRYVFHRLIYGTSVSGAHFIRAMDLVLGAEALSFTSIFVDDELITAPTWALKIQRLGLVLERHATHDVHIKLPKCHFCRGKVAFLGHILTPGGQSTDPEKVKAILEFPTPRNRKHLQSFLGLANFYRRFCKTFADCSAPLLPLIRKGARWEWTASHQEALDRLKQAFVDTVMLAYPIPGADFLIRSDASDVGISGTLSQIGADGMEYVLAFASRTLKGPELRYNICERECLACVFVLSKWRGLILGSKIVLETDNKSVSFLSRCRLQSARLARWAMYMQQFRLELRHIPGKENVAADVLSRYPVSEERGPERELTDGIVIARVAVDAAHPLKATMKTLPQKQKDDPEVRAIRDALEGSASPATAPASPRQERLAAKHLLLDGVLFRRDDAEEVWKAVIPKSLQATVAREAHEAVGHFGAKKVIALLRERVTWRGLEKDVKRVTAACDLCQRAKHYHQRHEGNQASVQAERPGDLVVTDLYGPLPIGPGRVQHLMVLMDMCTRYVTLYALQRATAASMVRRVRQDYIPTLGRMKTILSDHGPQYTARRWVGGLAEEGVAVRYSSIRHPQSNPAERVMKTLGQMFRVHCHDMHTRWPRLLPNIANWINTTHHDSIGTTPYFLQHGRHPERLWAKSLPRPPPVTSISWEQALRRATAPSREKAEQRQRKHDQQGRATRYQPGDEVLLRTCYQSDKEEREAKKFFLLYRGPLRVVREVAPNAYRLVDPRSHKDEGTHNVTNLRPYKSESGQLETTVCVVTPMGEQTWAI